MFISIAVKKDLYSIGIWDGGKLIQSKTDKIKDKDIFEDKYKRMIYVIGYSARMIRNMLESNITDDITTFEVSNSAIIKWFLSGIATDKYIDEFDNLLNTINSIPMKYNFLYSKKPKATIFLDEKDIKKVELGGISSLVEG